MKIAWVLFLVLWVGDLITTMMGGVKYEVNPVVVWLTGYLGLFWALVLLKIPAVYVVTNAMRLGSKKFVVGSAMFAGALVTNNLMTLWFLGKL